MSGKLKGSQKPEFYLGILVLFLVVGLLNICFAVLYQKIVLINEGTISVSKITAKSGSPADIQAAVNTISAVGGGTVYIPEGDWRCDQTPGGAVNIDLSSLADGAWLNIIGSTNTTVAATNSGQFRQMPAVILRSSVGNSASPIVATFRIYGAPNKHIRISGLAVLGKVISESCENTDIYLKSVDGFRIDHCFIDSSTEADILAHMSKGLIDHCNIDQTYSLNYIPPGRTTPIEASWGYGIFVAGDQNTGFGGYATWVPSLDTILGKYDWTGIPYTAGPVYIEDNVFNHCRHAITSSQYGYYVTRHNLFQTARSDGTPYIDVHGSGFAAGRGLEAYDNEITGGCPGFNIRGGGGVIFNNNIHDINLFSFLWNEGPGPVQEYVHDLWIWNNTLTNVGTIFNLENPSPVAGVDYFNDNFQGRITPTNPAPPRPGYIPYQYPHPLTLQQTP